MTNREIKISCLIASAPGMSWVCGVTARRWKDYVTVSFTHDDTYSRLRRRIKETSVFDGLVRVLVKKKMGYFVAKYHDMTDIEVDPELSSLIGELAQSRNNNKPLPKKHHLSRISGDHLSSFSTSKEHTSSLIDHY